VFVLAVLVLADSVLAFAAADENFFGFGAGGGRLFMAVGEAVKLISTFTITKLVWHKQHRKTKPPTYGH